MADQFTPVKLRSPKGNLFTAHSPIEVNDLVYGQGYTVVGNKDIDDVLPAGGGEAPKATPAPMPKKENPSG